MADKEDKTGEQVDLPLREMLADLLMETGSPQQAIVEYEADLRLNPNRFNGLYGAAWAAELTGQLEKARSYYSEVIKLCAGGDSNRAELRRAISLVINR
jgi:tetratricopeptide (TPR) repeat protein